MATCWCQLLLNESQGGTDQQRVDQVAQHFGAETPSLEGRSEYANTCAVLGVHPGVELTDEPEGVEVGYNTYNGGIELNNEPGQVERVGRVGSTALYVARLDLFHYEQGGKQRYYRPDMGDVAELTAATTGHEGPVATMTSHLYAVFRRLTTSHVLTYGAQTMANMLDTKPEPVAINQILAEAQRVSSLLQKLGVE